MAVFDKEKLQKIKETEKKDKKHTIMIVDDEDAHLRSMESLLLDEYEIITAKDGQEALDMIKEMENPENISLIISDQRMPKLTGIELFEKLLPILPNAIRIILTGYTDIPVIIDAVNRAQIYQFIHKPFEPEDLKLRVKRAVEAFELKQKVVEAGYTDYLTGMWHRRYLYEKISDYIEIKPKEYLKSISGGSRKDVLPNNNHTLLILDLDRFKTINDTYGYFQGDEVLKQFAEIIKQGFRGTDFIVRWGGDEFLIVLKYTSKEQVMEISDRLRREVEEKKFDLGNNEKIHLTCSIGFAVFPFLQSHPDLFTWEEVFDIATIALYNAKENRNAWIGLFSTDKTKPENLYSQTGKGKKNMLPNIEQLLENGELDVQTSIQDKTSLKWRKLDLNNL